MKCLVCHGDAIEASDVREEVHLGNDVVYVPLRVPVCQTCGEKYFGRRTVRYLEDVEEKLKSGRASLREIGKVLQLNESD